MRSDFARKLGKDRVFGVLVVFAVGEARVEHAAAQHETLAVAGRDVVRHLDEHVVGLVRLVAVHGGVTAEPGAFRDHLGVAALPGAGPRHDAPADDVDPRRRGRSTP